MNSILNFKGRKIPAFFLLGGIILSIGLMTGAVQASDNESISPSMISNNMFQYVGEKVNFYCTVLSIPTPDEFNANCDGTILVIIHGVSGLSTGEKIHVIGTVAGPLEGPNTHGILQYFPTVTAE
jgi:hypothetical protein